jgi:hypothetical protein
LEKAGVEEGTPLNGRVRTCFVHIGTHRTGTTSLQVILGRHCAELRRHHYVYPRAGRPPEAPNGHHNIAWEISGDRRFQREHGSAEDLVAEIRDWPHDVILSSEDFECAAFNDDRLGDFVRVIRAAGFRVRVVVYFRNQVDYAESLYQVLLGFGLSDAFEVFLGNILEDGRFRWREWTFPFCYRTLLTRLEAHDGVTIDARSYDRPAHGSVVCDLFSILDLNPAMLAIDTTVSVNGRPAPVDCIRLFCANRKGAALDRLEERSVAGFCSSLGVGPLHISEAARQQIIDRFQESNDYIRNRYGVQLTAAGGALSAGTSVGRPSMEAIFSAGFARSVAKS